MRFLALHGMGTSSEILEAQIGPLFAKLPGPHEVVYLAGERECAPAPGVSEIYPGPYLCYYNLPTQDQIEDAHDLVLNFIEDEGPFDGVIGFSQGAALASSLILRRARDRTAEPLFQVAVFICASLPFDLDAPPIIVNKAPGGRIRFLNSDASGVKSEISQSSVGAQSIIQEFHAQGYSGMLEDGMRVLRRYHPKTASAGQRLAMDIPTVNIVGQKDPYRQQGLWLAEMGGAMGTVIVDHGAGHEVARDMTAVRKMSRAAQDTIEKVKFQC
ncbi:MAG: hypothetical protein Q9219_006878 [cf. Caloplaca sp. 3 TL-2023]